jgi:hypothetical protein
MPNPSKRALRSIAALASKHSLSLDGTKLANCEVRIHTLYTGGSRLLALTDSVDIAFAQCGSKGEWVALLPAEKLIQLLENESLQLPRKPN